LDSYCTECLTRAVFNLPQIWLHSPDFRGCIEEKVDWAAYRIAIHELYWLSPRSCSDSDATLLTEEFAKNVRVFLTPRIIYHEIDRSLVTRPLHQLQRKEQVKLWNELRVAEFFGQMLYGVYDVECKEYKGIDTSNYGVYADTPH
jgi:hypothetical protein